MNHSPVWSSAEGRRAKVSNPAQTAITTGKLLNALWSTRTNDYGPRMKSCICKCKNYSDDHNINAFLLLMEIARLLKNEEEIGFAHRRS